MTAISSDAERIFGQLIAADRRQFEGALTSQLGDAIGEINQQGQLRSGRVPIVLGRIAAVNLRDQVTAAWSTLQRVLSDMRINPDEETAASMKTLMDRCIDQIHDRVTEVVAKLQPPSLGVPSEIAREATSQRERINAEIDLFVNKLRQQFAVDDGAAIVNEFVDLKADLDQLVHSEWQHADSLLQRYVGHFDAEQPLGIFVKTLLPAVDFTTWFDAAKNTMGAVIGSGVLDWPHDRHSRVSMQLEFLRFAAQSPMGIRGVAMLFFDGDYPSRTDSFVRQVVVPFHNDILKVAQPILEAASPNEKPEPPTPRRATGPAPFVAPERIDELLELSSATYDFRKLIRLSEELNTAWEHRSFLSVGMLTRAIIDHVPPIFSYRTFTEVANNYRTGRSQKDVFDRLENLGRKIADNFLHATIRKTETLPTDRQVDLSVEVDVLLGEVVRISSAASAAGDGR